MIESTTIPNGEHRKTNLFSDLSQAVLYLPSLHLHMYTEYFSARQSHSTLLCYLVPSLESVRVCVSFEELKDDATHSTNLICTIFSMLVSDIFIVRFIYDKPTTRHDGDKLYTI